MQNGIVPFPLFCALLLAATRPLPVSFLPGVYALHAHRKTALSALRKPQERHPCLPRHANAPLIAKRIVLYLLYHGFSLQEQNANGEVHLRTCAPGHADQHPHLRQQHFLFILRDVRI